MEQRLDGRYELIQALGKGGFGKTYLARDLRIPGYPQCVVKQLHCTSQDPKDLQLAQELFQREAATLARLGHHDQIPRLLAYFAEQGEFYLVEDYIEGQALSEELGITQQWPEAKVVKLLQDVLQVLTYVHSEGVIHRDIKPENLIRRRSDGRLVLIDFGAIKQLEQGHFFPGGAIRTGTSIGTQGYMPPEQAQGKPRPNSDIYALGMLGIHALTGHPAYGLPDNPHTGEVEWQQFATVSPELAQILNQMVRYHFQARYQSATEVLRDLNQLSSKRAAPPNPGPMPPAPRAEPMAASQPTGPTLAVSPASWDSSSTMPPPVQSPSPQGRPPHSAAPARRPPSVYPWLVGLTLALVIPGVGGAIYLLLNPDSMSLVKRDRTPAAVTPKTCVAIVRGNIRSTPTSRLGNQNLLRSAQGEALTIGRKETPGGWIELQLASGEVGWAHLDVIQNEFALRRCLQDRNLQLQQVADIPAPPVSAPDPDPLPPSPEPSPDPSPDPDPAQSPEVSPTPSPTPTSPEASPTPSPSADPAPDPAPDSAPDPAPTPEAEE
ncbi:protein kinase domain-containing protein [Lyngbya confervoides]|uniref:protein kinase domain-containing protein n=1 Tax=Lyngbya confervoides TaxID=207921 RepID=UPI00140A9020|nr:protein kinase [Lyngbya confervoides]